MVCGVGRKLTTISAWYWPMRLPVDFTTTSHQYRTYIVLFKVQCHCANTVGKFYKFSVLNAQKAIDTGDTVTHLDNATDLLGGDTWVKAGDVLS